MFNLDYYRGGIDLSNLQMFLIGFSIIAFGVLIGMLLPHKTDKKQNLSNIIMGSIMIFSYVVIAMFFIARFIFFKNYNLNTIPTILSLNLFGLVVIICGISMLVTGIRKNKVFEAIKKSLVIFALLIVLYQIYSLRFISKVDHIYHITTLVKYLQLIILTAFVTYSIKTNKNNTCLSIFWLTTCCYWVFAALIVMCNSINKTNISDFFSNSILKDMGITITYPYSLAVIMLSTIIGLLICCGIISLVYLIKRKVSKQEQAETEELEEIKNNVNRKDFLDLLTFTAKSICVMQTFIYICICAFVCKLVTNVAINVIFLFPVATTIISLVFLFYIQKLLERKDFNFLDKSLPENKKLVKLANFSNIFLGMYIKVQFENERQSIEFIKQRQAKAELKKQQALENQSKTENKTIEIKKEK